MLVLPSSSLTHPPIELQNYILGSYESSWPWASIPHDCETFIPVYKHIHFFFKEQTHTGLLKI
jgi:hypothetical protein